MHVIDKITWNKKKIEYHVVSTWENKTFRIATINKRQFDFYEKCAYVTFSR